MQNGNWLFLWVWGFLSFSGWILCFKPCGRFTKKLVLSPLLLGCLSWGAFNCPNIPEILSKQWDLLGSLQPSEGMTFYFGRFSFACCAKCWDTFVRTEVQCWCEVLAHSVCSVPSDTTSSCNTKVGKVTRNRTGMWVVLSQTGEAQTVFHMGFLHCSQSCLFWISLHVGVLIQLLLLESCWRSCWVSTLGLSQF